MTIRFENPAGVHQPASPYSQVALLEGPMRRLVVSGQVGLRPDGSLAEGGEAQVAQALENLRACLAAHGMGPQHLVKWTAFLTDRALLPVWRAHRIAFQGASQPTSTLLIVAGLADPRFVFEIEAEAAAEIPAG